MPRGDKLLAAPEIISNLRHFRGHLVQSPPCPDWETEAEDCGKEHQTALTSKSWLTSYQLCRLGPILNLLELQFSC